MFDYRYFNYPDVNFENFAKDFSAASNNLAVDARELAGESLLYWSNKSKSGGPQADFLKEALRWTGQSLIDGEFNSTPFNTTPEAMAAAAVEFGTDALLGAALGAAAVGAFFLLAPPSIAIGTTIGLTLTAARLAALSPLLLPAAKWAGGQAKKFVVDGIKDAFGEDVSGAIDQFYKDTGKWIIDTGREFIDATQAQLRRLLDPIVLDMDGDGVELIGREASNVYFDMDGDGLKELTGWVGPDDALLAIDENDNGNVDSIQELIGDLSRSGFAELATYDLNKDKIIDSKDAIYAKLKIWRDANSNGRVDGGEMKSVAEAGIRSIDLRYTTVSFTAEGNRIHEQSTFEWSDGRTGTVVDAWFDVSNVVTNAGVGETGNATIDALPDIQGYGNVESLRSAMLADGALASLVSDLVNRAPLQLDGARLAVEQILYRWADVTDVATDSRGPNFDGRKLAAIEAFLGTDFLVRGNANPLPAAVNDLQSAWNALVTGLLGRLMLAGSLGAIVADTAGYMPDLDRLASIVTPEAILADLAAAIPAEATTLDIADYWAAALPMAVSISHDVGIDTTTTAWRDLVIETLRPFGLNIVIDTLSNGVARTVLPVSEILDAGGAFALTSGDDTAYLAGTRQAVFGEDGNDRLTVSNPATDVRHLLDGGAGSDVLQAGAGADWLDGGGGSDILVGGLGNDTYTVDDVADVIVEAPGAGTDTVRASVSWTLDPAVENLILLGTAALNATGNAGANVLTGNDGNNVLKGLGGNDTLDGGAGNDTMEGGTGADTYIVDSSGDRIVETGSDIDTVKSHIALVLGTKLENLVLLGSAALNGYGNDLANSLTGNAAGNRLDGRGGADTMTGLAGDDTYVVDHSADRVVEVANGGIDTVEASISHTLANHVERLVLTGGSDINGTGNGLANTLTGNAGDNRLDGGGGADVMAGGAGDDTYVVDHVDDVVSEGRNRGTDTIVTSLARYTLGSTVENLQLYTGSSPDNVARSGTGNALANVLTGNNGANTLSGLTGDDTLYGLSGNDVLDGGSGNDILDGGLGDDRMTGGTGDDTYVVNSAADVVVEATNGGIDTVIAGISYILGTHVENLELTGSAHVDGQGNGLGNRLTGNSGNNSLDGGGGSDILVGGLGNDTYTVDDVADVIVEAPGAGTDTVRASVSWTLDPAVENLILLGTAALNATGNHLDNAISGNAGNNVLIGGLGKDTLTGNAGADIFVWRATRESTGSGDAVTDFIGADGDRIDVTAIDAVTSTAADDAFAFVSTNAFTAAGQVRMHTSKGSTVLSFNTDSNLSTVEMVITLLNTAAFEEAWLIA
ncbi:calcium-binding protein [Ensifer soli]|uniref:calcium-binding protein n=1 Tax=Ciceribacter sp. sgz301302 TaxID=3342379 RepID=UPI0035B78169